MSWRALPAFRVKAHSPDLTCESLSASALLELSNTKPVEATQVRAMKAYGQVPLSFEAHRKVVDGPVSFMTRGNGCNFYLNATEAVMEFRAPPTLSSTNVLQRPPSPNPQSAKIRMKLVGASTRTRVVGMDQLPGKNNYFIGSDRKKWRTNVPTYAGVRYKNAYPGVDVVFYGNQSQLEYDLIVAPGADFKSIGIAFDGARGLRVDDSGDLVIQTSVGEIRHRKPTAYQQVNGARKEVGAGYVISRRQYVEFTLGDYDKRLPLVIDPVLIYSTYFGSLSGFDFLNAIAFDAAGNAYIIGNTLSPDLQTTPGALQPKNGNTGVHFDAFIAKLNPMGTDVLYVTYLGGSSDEFGTGIAIDSKGNAYVAGTTFSNDFPTTANAFQSQSPGPYTHTFVAKLNATGTALVYGTYLGAPNENAFVGGIAIDAAGEATVAGRTDSTRFPVTPGAIQRKLAGDVDAFVARLNADGSALVYSTYLGGDKYDAARRIALDAAGNSYVAGYTLSTQFPTTRHAYQRQKETSDGSFVAKISSNGERLVYSTFIGGGPQFATDIAVDSSGDAYVTGYVSSPNMPTTPGAIQSTPGGDSDAFVTKLNDTGSDLVYSTFLGGNGTDLGNAIAVDSLGQAYITGSTTSVDFPLMRPLQAHNRAAPLYKSTDGGSNWNETPSVAFRINSLVVDPQATSILYASTLSDIIRSTDSGATWRIIARGVSGSLVIDPKRPTILYAFSGQTIYKSTDGGTNWQRIDPSSDGLEEVFTALVIDLKMPDTLYLAGAPLPKGTPSNVQAVDAKIAVIFKSTNGGANWTALDLGQSVIAVFCLAIDPQMTSTVYAGTPFDVGLLKSTDAGASWFKPMASGTLFASRLIIDPTNSEVLYAIVFNNVWKSTDGGASWTPTTLQQAGILEIDPQTPSTLYVANQMGLHKTTDGGASWHSSLDDRAITTIALDPKQTSTIYAPAFVTSDVFVAKLNTTGTALVYSTYLGGLGSDYGGSIAADDYGNAYVGGFSNLSTFPVTPNAYQTHGSNSYTGIVMRIADPAQPRITDVVIKGKKLFVSGEGFDRGAVITVNNVDLETQNDAATPSVLLISKRGGKQIAPGQTVVIRVRNADGRLSQEFKFTRGFE
jgi:photosystem II stability/assembly factor-like uncharacterized protein